MTGNLPIPDPWQDSVTEYKRRVRRRRIIVRIRWILLIEVVLLIISFWIFWPFTNVPLPRSLFQSTSCTQPEFADGYSTNITTTKLTGTTEYIGISNGQFAFDVSKARLDFDLKCKAALALKAKKPDEAQADWKQATSIDTNDAEALIYQENLKVIQSGSPYITFVVGSILTGDAVSIGRDFLQGAYIAQYKHNEQDNNTSPKIYLLTANFGSIVSENTTDASASEVEIVSRIVNMVKQDGDQDSRGQPSLHIKGVVLGLPFIVNNVISPLDHSGVPVVLSGSFSESQLQGTKNIFPVAPSTESEGQAAATYVGKTFNDSRIAIFQKEGDLYSQNLASAFLQHTRPDSIVLTEQYKSSDSGQDFQQKINDVGLKHVNLIYFAGSSIDVNKLMSNLPLDTNVQVMGGGAFYELGGYTGRNYSRLLFTAFAFPDEWKFPPQSHSVPASVTAFLSAYPQSFGGLQPPGVYGYIRPDSDVLLSNDALSVLVQGSLTASNNGSIPNFSPKSLIDTLYSFSGTNAFQGFSGRVSFGSDSAAQKAVLVLSVNNQGFTHMNDKFVYGCLQTIPC